MTAPPPPETPSRPGLGKGPLAFVTAVILAGIAAAMAAVVYRPPQSTMALAVFLLGALILARSSLRLGGRVEMLASEPFLFAALLANGPAEAVMVAGLTALTFCLVRPKRLPLIRLLFNVASILLTMAASSLVYLLAGGQTGASLSLTTSLLPLMAAVLTFFLVNSATVCTVIGLTEKISPWQVWREKFLWSYPSHLASASTAYVLVISLNAFGIFALMLALPPCLLIYYYFRGQQQRQEEQERHMAESTAINAELEKKAQDLQESNLHLEEANRMKTEFLANMSHELRTPLAAIIGFSELLQNPEVCELPPDAREWAGDIRSSGQHLLELINDILQLSKIEAGQMSLSRQVTNLGDLAHTTLNMIHPLSKQKGLQVGLEKMDSKLPGEILYARIDATKMRQVLYNLLSNAVKFTPEGGQVRIQLGRDGRDVMIRVSDTGIGIHGKDHEKIFREFMQVDTSMARRYQGTGLGLALVQKYVRMHGGSIHIDSELGRGARFEIRLPDCWIPITNRDAVTVVREPSQASLTSDKHGARIQVIEDNPINRRLIRRLLEIQGHEVLEAESAQSGISLARTAAPDLILMDINLPDIDGYEATRMLSQMDETRGIPIVALTAHVSADDEAEAYRSGCAGFIRKPIDTATFANTISDYLQVNDFQNPRADSPRI